MLITSMNPREIHTAMLTCILQIRTGERIKFLAVLLKNKLINLRTSSAETYISIEWSLQET